MWEKINLPPECEMGRSATTKNRNRKPKSVISFKTVTVRKNILN